MEDTTILRLEDLSKSFDKQIVLDKINLDVKRGEFLTLLGPSGCGKTTTLRIIAGLETPSSGKVYLEGEEISNLPPEKREVNTVFQNYALFPHMNVASNIAYGLKMRKTPKKTIEKKVEEMLSLIQLEGYGKRLPSQLSGGQRQRVAIARSAVLSPKLLLLDEPLGALDLQLRKQMQLELKRMQKRLGITFIYITHDQEEALNMSDRIALMNKGHFVQIDSPRELYEHPKTAFAANFIGETNLLPAKVKSLENDHAVLSIEGRDIKAQKEDWLTIDQNVLLCVRSQRLHYSKCKKENACLSGTFKMSHYGGGERTAIIELKSGQTLLSKHSTEQEETVLPGEEVCLCWAMETACIVKDDREVEAS